MKKEKAKQTEEQKEDGQLLPGIQTIINDQKLTQIREDGTVAYNLKTVIRVLSIVVLTVILILLIIFAATVIVDYKLAFPVVLGGDEKEIILCETSDLSAPSTHLYMPVTEQLGDLSQYAIPDSVDSMEGGAHNGEGYLAYTFFLSNVSDHELTVHEAVNIVSTTKHVEGALRVRIYRNGVATTYAQVSATGMPEYGTIPFPDESRAVDEDTILAEGESIRYTIVVWLEGDDPECVNEISGGTVRLSTAFTTGRS